MAFFRLYLFGCGLINSSAFRGKEYRCPAGNAMSGRSSVGVPRQRRPVRATAPRGQGRTAKPIPVEPTIEVIDVKVDKRSVAQLIAAGKYSKGRVNGNITEQNFPLGLIPDGKELVRVRFNRYLTGRDAVVAARAAIRLEPVTSIAFILTVGADKPDLRKEAMISDIDSVWSDDDSHVRYPLLWRDDGQYGLDLGWGGSGFGVRWWFLALRNITPKS